MTWGVWKPTCYRNLEELRQFSDAMPPQVVPNQRATLRPEFENRLRLVEPFRRKRENDEAHDNPLFHYCSTRTMTEILRGRTIWGTNLRHMNDAGELVYGRRVVGDALQDIGEGRSSAEAEFLAKLEQYLDPFHQLYDAYAICFSDRDDDLPQWRAYADGGKGYALGFDAQELRNNVAVRLADRERVLFGQVIYDGARQREILDAVLAEALMLRAELEASRRGGHLGPIVLLHAVRQAVGELVPFLKDPAFRAESEWRAVALSVRSEDHEDPDPDIRFREAQGRVFPFLEFRARPSPTMSAAPGPPLPNPPLPLRLLRAGPLVPYDIEEKSLKLFLASAGSNARLERSQIRLQ